MNDRELQQILFRSFDVIPLPILVSESIARHDGRSPDMIPQRRHRFLNKAFLEQLGYDLAELPDMASWFRLAYPDEGYRRTIIDSWHSQVEQSLSQGLEVAEMPALIRCKGGQSRWFIVTAQLGADAIPDGHIVTFRDIHDLQCMVEEVSRLSCTDPLTELTNRRGAQQQLQALWLHGEPLSVVLGDIDHFKQVNDRYGHPAGDAALCAVAHAMASQLLPGESLARWGGEEFLLILPGCDIEQAARRAEQLRQHVSTTRVPWQGDQLSLTISLGCASMKGQESIDYLLMMADRALYQAKDQGRNRVVISAQ
ncbi:GGDEF domain-containing protein [Aeromonas allosaccharophila]|uniref:GGDEF domain-containing protein n=1 Tax=Aeromonas TaxID=642 RepID=UPI000946FA38|nr:sensor domain-containing diguanylate cyclase [Aeromonas sp. YN13HZO-058]OLF21244.1 GGDEF domain-containing protein [Aeromonas sp. YN13HZO-058]BBT79535.1 GGDEF domain-containing protein [Aeromonas veronii]